MLDVFTERNMQQLCGWNTLSV